MTSGCRGHTAVQKIRPGAGFETAGFVEDKLGGLHRTTLQYYPLSLKKAGCTYGFYRFLLLFFGEEYGGFSMLLE